MDRVAAPTWPMGCGDPLHPGISAVKQHVGRSARASVLLASRAPDNPGPAWLGVFLLRPGVGRGAFAAMPCKDSRDARHGRRRGLRRLLRLAARVPGSVQVAGCHVQARHRPALLRRRRALPHALAAPSAAAETWRTPRRGNPAAVPFSAQRACRGVVPFYIFYHGALVSAYGFHVRGPCSFRLLWQ